MEFAKWFLIVIVALLAIVALVSLYPIVPNSPSAEPPGTSKLPAQLTADLQNYVNERDTIDALVVASSDEILLQHGETQVPINTHSVRKSVMNVLLGKAVFDGDLDIDASLKDIGIDDKVMPLTDLEKSARVEDLLKARSGIYIEAAGETPEMKAMRPQRGQHKPGDFYYYNNWDFNVLGSILVKTTGDRSVAEHMEELGRRLDFSDFDSDHVFFQTTDGSEHDQYVIYLSARDLAAMGQMMLRGGIDASGKPLISPEWIKASTMKYSELEDFDPLDGYGYLWSLDTKSGSYWATGWGGQYMLVDPANDLVIVTRNDTGRRLGHVAWALAGMSGQGQRSDVVAIHELITNMNIGRMILSSGSSFARVAH